MKSYQLTLILAVVIVVGMYINEQSDKQFYFLKVVLNSRTSDHAAMKSEILAKLVRIQRELEESAK